MLERLSHRARRWRVTTLKRFGTIEKGGLRLTAGDTNRDVAEALAAAFEGSAQVEVVHGSLLDVRADAIVCPGNSFGDMGGGFDKAVDDLHDGRAQAAVQASIASEYFGEVPVGAALIVSVPEPRRAPFLVLAPTMRVPGNVSESISGYLAMRAALVAVKRHNLESSPRISSVVVPGMCTGVGGMDYAEAATQMRVAFDVVIGERWREVSHPAMAPYASHDDRKR